MKVADTDLCHLMGLYEDILKAFRLLIHNLRINRKMEIKSDVNLGKVWSIGRGTNTIEMSMEETN